MARIYIEGKIRNLGRYNRAVDAARAYNNAALRMYGEFAVLNNIEDM
jgi:hypothetical protein